MADEGDSEDLSTRKIGLQGGTDGEGGGREGPKKTLSQLSGSRPRIAP